MKRFIFLNSHPIQYFAPLYQQMARQEGVELEVLYCSDQGVSEKKDEQFGTVFSWDIPLLEGYKYRFFHNYARRPGLTGFWGLQNWGIVGYLFHAPKSIIVINGWQFFIYIVAIIAGKMAGHTVCLRAESPLSRELAYTGKKKWLKRFLLGKILFRLPHYFLYIGKQNKAFYKYMGVADKSMIFTPYSVDNQRFQKYYPESESAKQDIRTRLHLPPTNTIVLYSGKFMQKKRPLDLLQAWRNTNTENALLVFMGEGALRTEMEKYIEQHQLHNVRLTGFVNQAEIPVYYAAADAYVMLSDADETWGLSTNEAMNLRLPVIISETTGCSADLVEQGVNGFRFPLGNVEDLSSKLQRILDDANFRQTAGRRSLDIINRYSYDAVIENLISIPQ